MKSFSPFFLCQKLRLISAFLFLFVIGLTTNAYTQGLSTFESPLPLGSTSWTVASHTYSSSPTTFQTAEFVDFGAGGSDRYLDNFGSTSTGSTYTISITGGAAAFTMQSLEIYLSSNADGGTPTNNGMVTLTGKIGGVTVFTETKSSGFPTSAVATGSNGGYTIFDFSALPMSGDQSLMNIDELEITLGGSFQYVAVDNFLTGPPVLADDPPEVVSIDVVGTPSSTATTVSFLVTFNENANNVSTDDFSIDLTGTTGNIASISGSGTMHTVVVENISGEGTVSIDLNAGTDIEDDAGNSGVDAFTAGEDHNVSRCFVETFESFSTSDFNFTSDGVGFATGTNTDFSVVISPSGGAGPSNGYVDNSGDTGTGKAYSITTPGTELFNISTLDLYLTSNGLADPTIIGDSDFFPPTNDGNITLEGRLGGGTVFTVTKNSGFPVTNLMNNGYVTIDFATDGAADYTLTNIDELRVTLGGAFIYVAIDNFGHCPEISGATPPIVESINLIGDPPSTAFTVMYEVVFNEPVNNASVDDFFLTTTGSAVGTISGISGSGTTYTLTITGIDGEGSIRPDLLGLTDIADLDGNSPPPPFTTGQVHLVSDCPIETFESVSIDNSAWTTVSRPFIADGGSGDFSVSEYVGTAAGGSDRLIDNIDDQGTGKIYSLALSNTSVMLMNSMETFLSSDLNGLNPTNDGTFTVRGKLDGTTLYTATKATGFPEVLITDNGFYSWDFATEGGMDNSMTNVDEIEVELGGAFQYIAIDNLKFCIEVGPPPIIGSVATSQPSVCVNAPFDVSATGLDNMDQATNLEEDYGIQFVYFSSATADPYTGGTPLGAVVPFGDISLGTAEVTGVSIPTGDPSTFIYAILSPAPTDVSIRPSAVTIIDVVLPTVTLTIPDADDELCANAGITVFSGGPGQPTGGFYSGPGVIASAGDMFTLNPAFTNIGDNTITYTYIDGNGCTNSATDIITVNSPPTVSATSTNSICAANNGTATATAVGGTGASTYAWSNGDAGATTSNLGPGPYTVTATDTKGCMDEFSVTVESTNTVLTVIANPTASVCTANNGAASASASGGTTPYTYAWSNGDAGATISNLAPMPYTVVATDANGCIGEATTTVGTFDTNPVVGFTAPADLCADAGVQINLTGGTPAQGTVTGDMGEYFGDGVTNNGTNYSFDPSTLTGAGVGEHTISYTYTDQFGCTNTASDIIEVFALPVVEFTAPDIDVCVEDAIVTGLGGGTPMGSTPPVLSEDFDYPDGSLTANPGWSRHSGTTGDLLVSGGQAVVINDGSSSEDANRTFTPVSGNIYYGIDFSVDDLGSPYSGTDNEYFAHFRVGSAFSAQLDIVPPTGVGDFSVGIASDESTADAVWATDLTYGTTYRAIVRYDQDNNIAELWIDASASGDASILGEDRSNPGDAVTSFALRQSNSSEDETVRVDNLIIGTTFESVLGGTPTGVYMGLGVTDDGNGMTFSFNPMAAAPGGGNVPVTYTYTDANGCSTSAMDDIFVNPVCCEFTATCPTDTDLGSYSCTELGDIPAPPTTIAEVEATPYGITFGDMPCGTITLLSVIDDITTYDVCAMGGQTVTRTVTVFDDLDGGGTLDIGEESMDCVYTFDIEEDVTAPVINCVESAEQPDQVNDLDFVGSGFSVGGSSNSIQALSFTVGQTGNLTRIESELTPSTTLGGTLILTIVDGNDPIPPQVVLATETITTTSLNLNFVLSTPIAVTAGQELTMIFSGTISGGFVGTPGLSDSYAGNNRWFSFNGASFSGPFEGDFDFITYVKASAIIPPIEGCDEDAITAATAGFAYSPDPVTVPVSEFPGTVEVEACGAATATYVDVITDSSCPNPILSVTRTWFVTDDCGNESLTCEQIITVEDTTAPEISCAGAIGPIEGCDEDAITVATAGFVYSADPVTVPVAQFPGTVDVEACGAATATYVDAITDSSCPNPILSVTRTWFVTDDCGNESLTCEQIITVEDTTAPEISCAGAIGPIEGCDEDAITVATAGFVYSADPVTVPVAQFPGTVDVEACGAATATYVDAITDSSCPNPILSVTRTWFVRDDCGNESLTCEQIITVEDTTAPEISCAGAIGPIEGCDEDAITVATAGFAYSSDPVTVPVAQFPGTVDVEACGAATATYVDAITDSSCPNPILSVTRTWFVTDDCGNESLTCEQIITVEDTTDPVFPNPPNQTIDIVDSGICPYPEADVSLDADPNFTTPLTPGSDFTVHGVTFQVPSGLSDNCSTPRIYLRAINPERPGSDEPCTRVLRLRWSVLDDCGNERRRNQTFTINDMSPPTIACPPSLTIECDESTEPANTGMAMGMDYCDTAPAISSVDAVAAGACPQESVITRTWTVTDACNMTASCEQIITVDDSTPPDLMIPDNEVVDCGASTEPTADGTGMATAPDNCDMMPVVMSADVSNVTQCDGGTIVRTWTATDACGNTISADQTILVNAPNAPVITLCPASITVTCESDVIPTPDALEAEVDCDLGSEVTVSEPVIVGQPGCDGTTYTFTYTITDGCDRTDECMQTFTLDNSAPDVTVPADATVTCAADIVVSTADMTVVQDCPGELILSVNGPVIDGPENCPNTTYTYTYRAIDECGRVVNVNRVFTIGENDDPTITAPADYEVTCFAGSAPNPDWATYTTACNNGVDAEVTVSGPVVSGPLDCHGTTYTYTFTVTDACGRSAFDTQTVTVVNEGPQISCPAPLQVFGCLEGGYNDKIEAWIETVDATSSCGVDLMVTNNFNGNAGICLGNNFTSVTFTATDACNRTSTCIGTIAITDTDPPVIFEQPQELLVACNGNTQATFNNWLATQGGAAAVDECWGDQVSWSASVGPNALNCANGPQAIVVTFTATDGCGNSASTVGVFNTKYLPNQINVNGLIQREDSEPVANVSVGAYVSGVPEMDMSDSAGDYSFPELEFDEDMEIVPEKNDDPLNGLSTWDLVLLQRHILNIETLNSPYKRIAADVNRSGNISTLDLILLRRLILHIDEAFTDNTSWRFVDADFVFPNPENPFLTEFPEVYNVIGQEEEVADFIAVKIGDLNLDGATYGLMDNGVDDRSDLDDLIFEMDDQGLNPGEIYQIDFKAENFKAINGFQFTLNFDEESLEIIDLISGGLPGFDAQNYGMSKLDQGVITLSWNADEAHDLSAEDIAFSLILTSNKAVKLSDVIAITSLFTKAEAYQATTLMNVDLTFNDNGQMGAATEFKLFQNQPNPFMKETSIGFSLPEAGEGSLEIYDVSGRLLHSETGAFVKGYNQIDLDASMLPSGVLYYQVSTANDSASKKMIKLE